MLIADWQSASQSPQNSTSGAPLLFSLRLCRRRGRRAAKSVLSDGTGCTASDGLLRPGLRCQGWQAWFVSISRVIALVGHNAEHYHLLTPTWRLEDLTSHRAATAIKIASTAKSALKANSGCPGISYYHHKPVLGGWGLLEILSLFSNFQITASPLSPALAALSASVCRVYRESSWQPLGWLANRLLATSTNGCHRLKEHFCQLWSI